MNIDSLNFLVLFGKTGCGKSDILKHLKLSGEQVLDFEEIARHKGSAFGGLDGSEQPSQKIFEDKIADCISTFDPKKYIWVEYESAYLGKLQIPDLLFRKLKNSYMFILTMNRDQRIRRIINEYSHFSLDLLLSAVQKLKKKMSKKKYALLRKSIRNSEFEIAVSILLPYYDKAYEYGMKNGDFNILEEISLDSGNSEKNAIKILTSLKAETRCEHRDP